MFTNIVADSQYRIRTQFPLIGEFTIYPTSNLGNLLDAISDHAVELRWTMDNFNIEPGAVNPQQVEATVVRTTGFGDLNHTLELVSNTGHAFHQESGYYDGAVIYRSNNNSFSSRIVHTEWLGTDGSGNDRMKVIVDTKLTGINPNDDVEIVDPTDVTSNTSYPIVFVPRGSKRMNDYVTEFILYNETYSNAQTTPQYRKIKSYHSNIRMLEVDGTTAVTGWSNTDVVSLRRSAPQYIGTVTNTTASNVYVSLPFTFPTTFSSEMYIHMTSGNAQYETRKIVEYNAINGTVSNATDSSTFTLAQSASTISGKYTNNYIQVTTGATTEVRHISSYTSERVVTVSTPFTVAPTTSSTYIIRTARVNKPFDGTVIDLQTSPSTGDFFELWNVTKDNHNGFHSFSKLSRSVPCKVQLIHLTIPNVPVGGSRGGMMPSYPFLWVTLSNERSHNTNKLVQTNNPNAPRALFHVSMEDCSRTDITDFLKIRGPPVHQIINLIPNQPIFFSLSLPDGTIYQTKQVDNMPPLPPNRDLQLSASFVIEELM